MNPSNKNPCESRSDRILVDARFRKPGQRFALRVTSTFLSLALITTPLAGAFAGDGYMVMQYQFELSQKPRFRQLNLTYQEGVEASQWSYHGDAKPGIVVPLYSMDPRKPGLFNRLDEPDSQGEQGDKKTGIGAILSAILGVGVLAAYAYATGKCFEDIGDAKNESAACDAVASGW